MKKIMVLSGRGRMVPELVHLLGLLFPECPVRIADASTGNNRIASASFALSSHDPWGALPEDCTTPSRGAPISTFECGCGSRLPRLRGDGGSGEEEKQR